MKNKYLEKISNKENLKLDLQNGVILDLIFDNKINAYRGYWKEEDMYIGIWEIKTLYEIVNKTIDNVSLI